VCPHDTNEDTYMPREGYINLTLRKSVRNRLARIARQENRTMTEELEHLLTRTEAALGIKGAKTPARAARQPAVSRGRLSGGKKKGR